MPNNTKDQIIKALNIFMFREIFCPLTLQWYFHVFIWCIIKYYASFWIVTRFILIQLEIIMTILRQTWTDRRLRPGAIFDEISLSELENIFIPSLTLKKSVSLYEIYLFKQKGSSNKTWPKYLSFNQMIVLNWMILLRMKAPDIPELFLIFWNSLDWPSLVCTSVNTTVEFKTIKK